MTSSRSSGSTARRAVRATATARATATTLGHATVAAAAVGAVLTIGKGSAGDAGLGDRLVSATGLVALLWAYVGLVLGLLVGIRPRVIPAVAHQVPTPTAGPVARVSPHPARTPRRSTGRSTVLSLHRQLDIVVLGLTVAHLAIFALLTSGGSLLVALVPGVDGPQSFGFALGILALYLAALLGPTHYLRDRIGRRTWLVAHQLAAFTYALALWHALGMGADLRLPGIARTVTWVLQIPLLALIALRLFRPRRAADQLSARLRRGRYRGVRHTVLRAAMATGLIGSALFVLVMALIASRTGQHGTN